jgi:hypothetical protein
MINDIDEIIDPELLIQIKKKELIIDFHGLILDFYYYNLHCKHEKKWNYHSKILSYKKYKELGLTCSKIRYYDCPTLIPKSGWHLSCFGDVNYIKKKMEAFSHQEYNKEYYTDINKIKERIEQNKDFCEKEDVQINYIPISENDYLPVAYETYLTQFYT